MSSVAQQPYFLRALYEWCVDSGLTPHLTVRIDSRTRVPPGFAKDGRIVLNVGPSAVRNLNMDNDWVTFSARFGGLSHNIEVPIANVEAIYARETGEGMQFSTLEGGNASETKSNDAKAAAGEQEAAPARPKGGPQLKIVK